MLESKLPKRRLFRDTRGLTTVEYVIVLALIAVVSVKAWQKFGSKVNKYITDDTQKIDDQMNK